MSSKPFTMDFKVFNKDLKKLLEKSAPEEIKLGLFKAASEMLHDADKKEPKTPFLKGDLRGAKIVNVKETKNEIYSEQGYNIIYAAYQHEKEKGAQSSYNLPGSGPKFLETKMMQYKENYIEIAIKHLRRLLK